MDAPSPLGITWVFLVLSLIPLVLLAVITLALMHRRDLTSTPVGLVVLAALAAATWTFFTTGQEIRVAILGDPGAYCVTTDYAPMNWSTDCGTAFAKHLILSGGPSLVMLGVCIVAIAAGVRRRRASGSTRLG